MPVDDKRPPLYSVLSLLEIVCFSFIYAIRAQRQPKNWVVPALRLPAPAGPVSGRGQGWGGVGTTPLGDKGAGAFNGVGPAVAAAHQAPEPHAHRILT